MQVVKLGVSISISWRIGPGKVQSVVNNIKDTKQLMLQKLNPVVQNSLALFPCFEHQFLQFAQLNS